MPFKKPQDIVSVVLTALAGLTVVGLLTLTGNQTISGYLTVSGSSTSETALVVNATNTNALAIRDGNGTNIFRVDTSTDYVYVSNKLGVATTTPSTYLNVAGNIRAMGVNTVLTGSIDTTASTSVVGVGTAFVSELIPGDQICVFSECRMIRSIEDNTHLTVASAFTDQANDTAVDAYRVSATFLNSGYKPILTIDTDGRTRSSYNGLTVSDQELGSDGDWSTTNYAPLHVIESGPSGITPPGGIAAYFESDGSTEVMIGAGDSFVPRFDLRAGTHLGFARFDYNGIDDLSLGIDGLTSISIQTGGVAIGGDYALPTVTGTTGLYVPDGIYAHFEQNFAGAPTATHCDHANELGRIAIDTTNNRLYICMGATRGWDYAALTN